MSDRPHIDVQGNRSQRVRNFEAFESNVFAPPLSAEEQTWNVAFDLPEASVVEEPEKEDEEEIKRRETEAHLAKARETSEQASRDAERMIEEARRRSEEIEAIAYQAGFSQGEEAGHRLSEQKAESAMRSFGELLETIEAQRDEYIQSSEERLVRIAFLIAQRLIHRELRQDPSVVLDVVREAVSRVRRASHLTLYVSPHDFKFIEGRLDDLTGLTSRETRIAIEPDSEIVRGGCRVVSNTGEVDALIDSMIRNLQERLWVPEDGDESSVISEQ